MAKRDGDSNEPHDCYELIAALKRDLDSRHKENVRVIEADRRETQALRKSHEETAALVKDMHRAMVGKPLEGKSGLVSDVASHEECIEDHRTRIKKLESEIQRKGATGAAGATGKGATKTNTTLTWGASVTAAILAAKAIYEFVTKTKGS